MTVPALGFGTAGIMGRISRRTGSEALERAHAAGIRHFDTARSYGWGEAEGVVGTVLGKHRREDIRLVTKCGILPVRNSHLLRLAKSTARWALTLAPGLKAQVRRIASSDALQPAQTYDIAELAGSLKTSLAELGVSYIDDLLLHNFSSDRPGLEEVGAWFRELQRAGIIRRFGFSVEGDLLKGLACLSAKELLADAVVQVPVSHQLLSLPSEWRSVRFIAHSPFTFMRQQAEAGNSLVTLAGLLPALGEACRCDALVCSMFGADHLAANVANWKSCSR
ncbi:aldo/keto reductase [Reyranella sp.]|uniref:aldo/keto reductase n=1 Tax=Reyranella sp. TaxID=1929291 RepID=UPI003D11F3FD